MHQSRSILQNFSRGTHQSPRSSAPSSMASPRDPPVHCIAGRYAPRLTPDPVCTCACIGPHDPLLCAYAAGCLVCSSVVWVPSRSILIDSFDLYACLTPTSPPPIVHSLLVHYRRCFDSQFSYGRRGAWGREFPTSSSSCSLHFPRVPCGSQ